MANSFLPPIGPQGPPGAIGASGPPAIAATPAAVSSVDPGGTLQSGSILFVQSLNTYFILNRASTATPDNVRIIAATGGGNWLKTGLTVGTDLDIYLASTGSDTNTGFTAAAPIRSWAQLENIWPAGRTGALRIHLLDAGPFVVNDGPHNLPTPDAGAPPVQIIGTYVQDNTQGGGGTRTVSAVGTDSITDQVGGLTASYYGGTVAARLSGAAWTRYFITNNTANVLTLAFPWQNGTAPQVNDTFQILFASSLIQFNNVIMNLNGNVLVCDGVAFQGVGVTKSWLWTNGVVYLPGCRVVPANGRFCVENGGIRTFDQLQSTQLPSRYPTQMPDLLGFFAYTGDTSPGVGGDITACVTSQNSTPSGSDLVNDSGGSIFGMDCYWSVVNENVCLNSSREQFRPSSPGNSHSRLFATSGSAVAVQGGGTVQLVKTDISNCTGFSVLIQGGKLITSGVTGSGNSGYGIQLQQGELIDDGTSTITGSTGDLLIEGRPLKWRQFTALGSDSAHIGKGRNAPEWFLESIFWGRADQANVVTGKVATLYDLSVHGTDLTQATAGLRPAWNASGINGLPSVAFDGGGSYLYGALTSLAALDAGGAASQLTILAVAEFTSAPGNGSRMWAHVPTAAANDTTNGSIAYITGAGAKIGAYTSISGFEADISVPSNNTPFVYAITIDGSKVSAYLNGQKRAATADTDLVIANELWLGCGKSGGGPTFYNNMTLSEIVIVPGILGVEALTQAHRYFGTRYNISVL